MENSPRPYIPTWNGEEEDLPDPYADTPGGPNHRAGEAIVEVRL